MENLKSKLIIIYGKAGSYKSTISKYLQTSISDNSIYLDLEKDKYTINDVIECLSLYDMVVVDYIELLDINIDDIRLLKKIIMDIHKTLILVSCCASNKELINNNYNKIKRIIDISIILDTNKRDYINL